MTRNRNDQRPPGAARARDPGRPSQDPRRPDLRAAEDALRDSEDRYRAFVEQSSEGIWRMEIDPPLPIDLTEDEQIAHVYRYAVLAECNDAMARMYGFQSHTEIQGTPLSALLPPSDPHNAEFLRAAVRSGYRLVDAESHEVDREGRPKFFLNNFVGIVRDGLLARAWGTQRDVTERKQVERERELALERAEEARTEAEHASHMKDEFLAILSHELRTPLQSMLGWARLLRAGTLDAGHQDQAIRSIERNASAQARLIEDLLDMSAIMSGTIRLNLQPVDMAGIVDGALESMRPAIESRGYTIERKLDPSVGSIQGDPHRLQQVVWNLISNAIKFTPSGGRIEIALERHDAQIELRVSDTGQGIAGEFLGQIFDRFRQGDFGTRRRSGGLGLGLAIVRNLVELHGGAVEARSDGAGQGSTFVVRLPVSPNPPARSAGAEPWFTSPSMRTRTEAPASLDDVRVLVVDDEPDARELVARILSLEGATVDTASSVAEALAAVRSHHPAVIVSDIGMPDQDGYDLMRELLSLEPELGPIPPAIALTAFARNGDRLRALKAGYHMHIAKPVDPTELVMTVASLARLQRSR